MCFFKKYTVFLEEKKGFIEEKSFGLFSKTINFLKYNFFKRFRISKKNICISQQKKITDWSSPNYPI